jgi:hypothetical protein
MLDYDDADDAHKGKSIMEKEAQKILVNNLTDERNATAL